MSARIEMLRGSLENVGDRRRRSMASTREPDLAPAATLVMLSDAEFFEANQTRMYRVRSWERADMPNLHPRETPLRIPVCTVVERGRFGPIIAAQPRSLNGRMPTDTDAGARAILAAAPDMRLWR